MSKTIKYMYVKLGKKATIFSDPSIGVLVRNNEVLKIEENLRNKSKKLDVALRQGHLEITTETDYNLFSKENNGAVSNSGKATKVNYEAFNREEILKYMSDAGYVEEDLVKAGKIKDLNELRAFAKKLEEEYE